MYIEEWKYLPYPNKFMYELTKPVQKIDNFFFSPNTNRFYACNYWHGKTLCVSDLYDVEIEYILIAGGIRIFILGVVQ